MLWPASPGQKRNALRADPQDQRFSSHLNESHGTMRGKRQGAQMFQRIIEPAALPKQGQETVSQDCCEDQTSSHPQHRNPLP